MLQLFVFLTLFLFSHCNVNDYINDNRNEVSDNTYSCSYSDDNDVKDVNDKEYEKARNEENLSGKACLLTSSSSKNIFYDFINESGMKNITDQNILQFLEKIVKYGVMGYIAYIGIIVAFVV